MKRRAYQEHNFKKINSNCLFIIPFILCSLARSCHTEIRLHIQYVSAKSYYSLSVWKEIYFIFFKLLHGCHQHTQTHSRPRAASPVVNLVEFHLSSFIHYLCLRQSPVISHWGCLVLIFLSMETAFRLQRMLKYWIFFSFFLTKRQIQTHTAL